MSEITCSLTIVSTLDLKNSANASGKRLFSILVLFKYIVLGNFGMLISFAIFTASQRDFELPGMILRLTELVFFDKKWFFISTFKFFIRSLNSFEGFTLVKRRRRFLKLIFLFITPVGLVELEEQLFKNGSRGATLSMIVIKIVSNLFQ